MSKFLGKQVEECEILEPEEPLEKICPSCIPNPYAPDIDWFTSEEPYFDEKKCEFIIKALGHKTQDAFINGISITTTATDSHSPSYRLRGGASSGSTRSRRPSTWLSLTGTLTVLNRDWDRDRAASCPKSPMPQNHPPEGAFSAPKNNII